MLFPADLHERIRSGEVTVAFRRWKRPTVVPGGTLQSPAGLLRIDEVEVIEVSDITLPDALAAGFDGPAAVLPTLQDGPGRRLHRVRFHREGDDPRLALRERSTLTADERAELDRVLDRWDCASRDGPWTGELLGAIADRPGERSADLAARLGVDQPRLKRRVRQLKGLGLTESLEVGYRLAPRGLAHQGRDGG